MADKNVLFHGLDLRLTEIASNVHGISQVPYGKTAGGVFVPLTADADGNLSVVSAASGIADLVTLLARIGEVDASPTANTVLDRLKTLAATLATEATVATLATEATLAALAGEDFATQTTLASILAKIIAAPATEAKQDTLIAKDFATQTTLAAILAKIIAAPATEAKQDTLIAKDFATQTTLAAILAKIIAAPATEAKQDTLIAKDFATQTTLAAILAKIIAAPATEAKQDTLIAKDFATQTTLATLLADATFTGRLGEVQASPTANTVLDRLKTLYTTLTDGNQTSQLYSSRDAGTLHRDAITAVDKLSDFVDASVTIADNGSATGSLTNNTAYYVTAIPGNRWGNCKVNTNIDTLTTAASGLNTHSIRATIAQSTGADYYDLFLSTDAAPKWVARVTEAQRAAGDYEVTGVGTVASGGGNPAGTVDINVAGTGIQTSNAVFAQNNAYTPASVTPKDCTGKTKAIVLVKAALTDLRSAPTLNIIPFFANQVSANDWHQGALQPVLLVGGLGQALEQVFEIDVAGSTGLAVLIDTISGQGNAASVWVELV